MWVSYEVPYSMWVSYQKRVPYVSILIVVSYALYPKRLSYVLHPMFLPYQKRVPYVSILIVVSYEVPYSIACIL